MPTSTRSPRWCSSEVLNYDFCKHGLDAVVSNEMMEASGGIRGLAEGVCKSPRPRGHRARPRRHRATLLQGPRFVDTATQVADQMQEWFQTRGTTVSSSPPHLPGAFEEFVRMVVTMLRERGLFRTEHRGSTLRDHLAIDRPAR